MNDDSKGASDPGSALLVVTPEDEAQFHLGFERMKDEIMAVDASDLDIVNLDVPLSISTMLGAEPEVQALRPELALLPGFEISHVDKLRDRALALGHLYVLHRAAGETPDDLPLVVDSMVTARERLHTHAAPLVRERLLDRVAVNKQRSGNAHRMIAYDVIGLTLGRRRTQRQIQPLRQQVRDPCYTTGPRRRHISIVTVWIVLHSEDVPRFVTAVPGDKT